MQERNKHNMNVSEMVNEKLVNFGYEAKTKDDVIKGLGKMMYDAGKVNDLNKYIEGLYEREAVFSTGVGNGVAIPHCKIRLRQRGSIYTGQTKKSGGMGNTGWTSG